jgi:hypothetical protein
MISRPETARIIALTATKPNVASSGAQYPKAVVSRSRCPMPARLMSGVVFEITGLFTATMRFCCQINILIER